MRMINSIILSALVGLFIGSGICGFLAVASHVVLAIINAGYGGNFLILIHDHVLLLPNGSQWLPLGLAAGFAIVDFYRRLSRY